MSSLDDMIVSEPIREGFLDVRERIPNQSNKFYQFMECLGERISKNKMSPQGLMTQLNFLLTDLKYGYDLENIVNKYPQLNSINDKAIHSFIFKIPEVLYAVSPNTGFSKVVADIIREVDYGKGLDILSGFDRYDYKKAC